VESVLAVGRTATGQKHAKLRELVRADLYDLSAIEAELAGNDTCFFCLGVSSAGMSEQDYTKVTYDLTLAVAQVLVKASPSMTFVYVSGAGTDSSEHGRTMWARVKGRTENALLRLPFRSTYLFRPAFVQPLGGIVSRTPLYRAVYAVLGPLYPVWRAVIPGYVTTTEAVGKAMLEVAKRGAATPVLENSTINALGRSEQRGG
jgi:uncharacterized protein YbjT (DUF2867 family)